MLLILETAVEVGDKYLQYNKLLNCILAFDCCNHCNTPFRQLRHLAWEPRSHES